MNDPRQIIVVREDILMSSGKTAAQVAHAAMGVFFEMMRQNVKDENGKRSYTFSVDLDSPMYQWIEGPFTKVVVGVPDLDGLMNIYTKAASKNLPHCLIIDSGRTEFNGQPTETCLAIGPVLPEQLVGITDHLKLLVDDSRNTVRSYEKLIIQMRNDLWRLRNKGVDVESVLDILKKYETKKGMKFKV